MAPFILEQFPIWAPLMDVEMTPPRASFSFKKRTNEHIFRERLGDEGE